MIAVAKGRNEYFAGALCEAYPEVQSHWMSWVGECIAAGVDGVDFRVANHSCWTDTPDIYGFNEPVAKEYRRRYGVDPNVGPYEPELIGALRGEFYDQFLRTARERLSAAGKRMQLHLEVESFRPDATLKARHMNPGNIAFNWRGWLRSGLADETTLAGSGWMPERALGDPVGREMVEECATAGVPAHFRQPVMQTREPQVHADCMEAAFRDEGVGGYMLYESGTLLDPEHYQPGGPLVFLPGLTEALRDRARSLGFVD